MFNECIVRAWKDRQYSHSLSQEMRCQLPEHPAGTLELLDEEMELILGGNRRRCISQPKCCPNPTIGKKCSKQSKCRRNYYK